MRAKLMLFAGNYDDDIGGAANFQIWIEGDDEIKQYLSLHRGDWDWAHLADYNFKIVREYEYNEDTGRWRTVPSPERRKFANGKL